MASRKFVFGGPPFEFLASHLAQDADFSCRMHNLF